MLNQARRRMSITNRLRWSYLISSTLPLLLVGALLIGTLFQVQQRNALASQQALAERIAGAIATFVSDLEQLLLRAGRDLQPENANPTLTAAVQRLTASSPDLRAITVVNAEGATVAQALSEHMAAQGLTPALVPEALIDAALRIGQGGRSTISVGVDGQPGFLIVLPIRDAQSGRIEGALAAEVSSARLEQILRLVTRETQQVAYLVDAQHSLLLGVHNPGWQPPDDLTPIFQEGQSVGRYQGGTGQQMIGARAPVAPISTTSWSVVVEQPSSELFVEVYRSLALLGGLVALVGMLALSWALYQARRIVQPIRALTAGARELAEGQLNHRIIVEPGDELGQLASTFNEMAGRLQGSLHEIEQQNERLRSGLILARDIQHGLLPTTPPWRSDLLSVYGRSLPANEVGGDFYSYMVLLDGRAAVAVGDISGKGVAAALLMALTSSTIESQAHFLDHPGEMLQMLHTALSPRLQANQMNAAILVAVFSADARTVTLANAGMIAPLLVRCTPGAGCSFVDVGGLPIGTPLSCTYQEVTVPLMPGDTLLLLSDGIIEAHDGFGQLFGFERLEALVNMLPPDLELDELVEQIIATVLDFVGGAEAHDDITLIAMRPNAQAAQHSADVPQSELVLNRAP
jgi:serine phosphatase RsbU (regulator of sigma subunit)